MWWTIGVVSNAVIAAAYIAIGWAILRPLLRTGQLRQNRLGAVTGAIFLTCGVHQGLQAVHMLLPTFGIAVEEGQTLRAAWDWRMVVVDLLAAAVAVYYWRLRGIYGPLVQGAKLFEDLREKQRQALEINDSIVQGLTVAQMALELDEREESKEALERTLVAAREIVTDLLGEVREAGAPPSLRRRSPARVKEPVP